MPWDSVDKYRDEDLTDSRKRSRRRFRIGGRRKNDNNLLERPPIDLVAKCSNCGAGPEHIGYDIVLGYTCNNCGATDADE